jgi:hypothetical protein
VDGPRETVGAGDAVGLYSTGTLVGDRMATVGIELGFRYGF